MSRDPDEVERVSHAACLKAAVHYTVGRICDDMAEKGGCLPVQRQTVAALTELVHREVGRVARDLSMLAMHCRRSTVTADDVLFVSRNSGPLHEYLQTLVPPPKKTDGKRKVSSKAPQQ
ncbi:hypothetical protein HPB52_021442 [Rhipicephalus sanguineus]|uniref:Centromere protein S n=2 Tax=Rhipicephalus sanguineus TaxID=34632 RepID=A0A9D4PSY7_RHISA|nr:hypothetical protein HPB52_021442 [Rhipicephalus sanguineus]